MSDATEDLDALDDLPRDPQIVGSVMVESVRQWCEMHNEDAPTIVSRVVVIAECHDETGRWLERGGFSVDGNEMTPWETLGFLEYSRMCEKRMIAAQLDECEDEDSDD